MSGGNAADKISSHAEKVLQISKWLTWMQKNSGRQRQLSRIGLAVIGLSLGFSAGQPTAADTAADSSSPLRAASVAYTYTLHRYCCCHLLPATIHSCRILCCYLAAARRSRSVRRRCRTYQSINVFTAPLPASHPKKEELEMVFLPENDRKRADARSNTMYIMKENALESNNHKQINWCK